jgi:hypothetical protein
VTSSLNPNLPPGGNFDLSLWKLDLPIDKNGEVEEVQPAQLVGDSGFTDLYFYTNSTDGGMMFFTPEDGAIQSGSAHPRSELREMNADGSEANWPLTGTNSMSATIKVLNVVDHTCIGQIHGGDAIASGLPNATLPLLLLFYYGTGGSYPSGELVLSVEPAPTVSGGTDYDITNIPMGTTFDYTIALSGDNEILITINGNATTYTIPAPFIGYGFYFKAGDYLQEVGLSSTIGGLDEFYALNVAHSN